MTNEARIETCTFCNYTCKFCPHKDNFSRKQEIMDTDTFNLIVDKLPSNITDITISGFGEPFLDPTLFAKIAYVKKKNMRVHILTNGSFLNKENIDILVTMKVDDLRISLHAVDESIYKNITGWPSNKHILSMIDYAAPLLPVTITADIIEENESEVEALKAFASKVNLVEIWKPHNWADWGAYRRPTCRKITCGRPFNGPIQVQVDGTVNMCCFDYNGKLLIGDLKIDTLERILSGKSIRRIQTAHKSADKTGLLCGSCDQLYFTNDVIIYNSKYDAEERMQMLSTTHKKI